MTHMCSLLDMKVQYEWQVFLQFHERKYIFIYLKSESLYNIITVEERIL